MLDFVQNPENKEKCIELGLIAKPIVKFERVLDENNKEWNVKFEDGVEVSRREIIDLQTPPVVKKEGE
jgi:hypothetical protein